MCVTLFSLLRFSLVFVHVPHSLSSLPLGLAAGGTLVCFCIFWTCTYMTILKHFIIIICVVYVFSHFCLCPFFFSHLFVFLFATCFVVIIIFFFSPPSHSPFISHKLIHDTPHPKFSETIFISPL